MTFHWPHAFWLLLIPLALFVRDLLRHRTSSEAARSQIRRAEAHHNSLVIHEAAFKPRATSQFRLYACLALVAATVALARPQWGRIEEPVFDQSREIIIALDLSRSMLATDVSPSRLERARLLITSLLERLKGERVGLIVFSGTAFLQSPLSSDYEILREFLPLLNPAYLPEGGTNYNALLDTTLSAFGASGSADRFLIVLSDGEAQNDSWRQHLEPLKTKDIRVLGLGIGTSVGSMIPDGEGGFVKNASGAVVLSRLDTSTLRALSEQTNGVYTDASNWVDLSDLIQRTVEQGRQGAFKEKTNQVRLAEHYQWPLAAAVLFFLLAYWRDFPVQPRPRTILLNRPPVLPAALLALALLSAGHHPLSAAPAESGGEPTAALTELVARLSRSDQPTAADYAALARTTADIGEKLRSEQKPVTPGIVHDALAAADAGEKLSARAADWADLRTRLRHLLDKDDPQSQPPEPKKSDEKKPDQDKNEKPDDSSKDDSKGQSGKDDPQSQSSDSPSSDKSESGKPKDKDSSGKDGQNSDPAPKDTPSDKPGQNAFGDMKDSPPPSERGQERRQPDSARPEPKSAEMQQVGGTVDQNVSDPARQDPSLAVPMQKLDQVKQGDSPARLFQLLQEPGTAPPKPTNAQTW